MCYSSSQGTAEDPTGLLDGNALPRSFHVNMGQPLPVVPKHLEARGLHTEKQGQLAYFSAWRPPRGPPWKEPPPAFDNSRRGIIELRTSEVVKAVADKKCLANFLHSHGVTSWAPFTALSYDDLCHGLAWGEAADSDLWFLKHSKLDRNEGVTVHAGRAACVQAWASLPDSERNSYVAQQEVRDPLLDDAGCKVTLRVYVALLAEVNPTSLPKKVGKSWMLVRREFLCRSHPLPYDTRDAVPDRHVYSTLGHYQGVRSIPSRSWQASEKAWPRICSLLQACLSPLLPNYAQTAVEAQGTGLAGLRRCELLGIDLLVDTSFRPWLLEVNQSPQLQAVKGNQELTANRMAVVSDFLDLVLDFDPATPTDLHARFGDRQGDERVAWQVLSSAGPRSFASSGLEDLDRS
eukprot:TRINITY_DN80155_c0_g1_i1.p1 TRINITY_DN80155_c0_g1~~TRINITY_DN80155_c0_g1_i1.p1  ORF type:complete len:405 (+),score=43.00 TRINITY_DN80155_c0_g1_i1:55-1269(+)